MFTDVHHALISHKSIWPPFIASKHQSPWDTHNLYRCQHKVWFHSIKYEVAYDVDDDNKGGSNESKQLELTLPEHTAIAVKEAECWGKGWGGGLR